MTTRQEKVNSLLQQILSEYLATEKFEGISGLLTITAVDVSPDLEQAKIYVSCLGQDPQEVLKILRDRGPMSADGVAVVLGVVSSTAWRILEGLEKDGRVKQDQSSDPRNRRYHLV